MRLPAAIVVLVMATASPHAQSAQKKVFGTSPGSPVSSAVMAGGLIYVAGTVGPASGPIAKGDIKAQTKQTLDNISGTLKRAGSNVANAVAAMVYLRRQEDVAAMNEVYATYWPKDPPARTTVLVSEPLTSADALIEISMVAVLSGSERVVLRPAGWSKPTDPISYGIKTGNTVFLSGLLGRNGKDNTPVKGDITVQTKAELDNAQAILKEAGMTLADVVSARVFLRDEATFQGMNTTYRPYFPNALPARATVRGGVPGSDDLVQIAMVAVKDAGRKAFTTPNADGSPGTASPNNSSAIQVGNRLYLAGITGNTPANKGAVRAQTAEVLSRVGRTLEAAGFDWSDVVDAVVYLPDMTTLQEMDAVFREVLGKHVSARATVGIALMGADATVEIIFTAVKE